MPSSTSSSEHSNVSSKYDRALPTRALGFAAATAVVVMVTLMAGWEAYWRADGNIPGYRNSEGLWAMHRRRIDAGEGDKTVIIGSSRMFFNTQLDAWEEASGERPIMLALEGTTPLPVLEDLADDPDFTGTLFVGIAPDVFFIDFQFRQQAVERYGSETPTQWFGQRVSMLIEPFFAFYQPDYALFTVLKRQPLPVREGVFTIRDVRRIATYDTDRNARLYPKFNYDEEYTQITKDIWMQFYDLSGDPDPEFLGMVNDTKVGVIDRTAAATKKLQDRGIEVIFVRGPSSGDYDTVENIYFPRSETWDILIEETGALGIHYKDHEELQGFNLPEWSHIIAEETDRFTHALYEVIQRERARRASGGE